MRRLAACAVPLLLLACALPAQAVIGSADNVPAATLLIPYFEVDLANVNGATTLVTIQNSSATAVLAHVTLWTDAGVGTQSFVVYLTGYDTQAINLRDIFNGIFPVSASDGQDPADTISNQGRYSQDINFASCGGNDGGTPGDPSDDIPAVLPYPVPALTAAQIADLRALHTGGASTGQYTGIAAGQCAGFVHGDSIARGYVTVNTVNTCRALNPWNLGYFFSGGSGDASNQNVLLGDWMLVNPSNNFMEADLAVAIEASYSDPLVTTPGNLTFYASLPSVANQARDNREPLPTIWAAPFMSERSSLRVWRDPGVAGAAFACASPPAALANLDTVAFDTQENPTDLADTYFPYRSQTVRVGAAGVPATPKQGWLFLNLESAPGSTGQAWVSSVLEPESQGRFTTGTAATPIGHSSPSEHLLIRD